MYNNMTNIFKENLTKSKLMLFIALLLTASVLYYYYMYTYFQWNKRDYYVELNGIQRTKTILYWNKFFRRTKDYYGSGADPFKFCEIKDCYITSDRNYMPVDEFDAVLFHVPLYSFKKDQAPEKRNAKQRYIFYTQESYIKFPTDKNVPKHFYNWTFTHWRKSDLFGPYALVKKQETNYDVPNVDFVRNKTKFAAWFVSNCNYARSKRNEYVKELQKYVEVDIYGKCGNRTCPRSNSTQCYHMLEDNYLFYLSFENSICEDYITEKLYYPLQYNVLPITYGFGNYTELAPPHSLINTADFQSVKDLAQYLIYLREHPEEYLKYFEWKKHYRIIEDGSQYLICNLCKKLHTDYKMKNYEDIYKWWHNSCVDHNKIKIPK